MSTHQAINKMFNRYLAVGAVYNIGRTMYWMPQLDDQTFTQDGLVQHDPTAMSWVLHGACSVANSVFFPLTVLWDIDRYQKSQMGIQEPRPPYPFNSLKFKQRAKE
jgi:hypothetical protein